MKIQSRLATCSLLGLLAACGTVLTSATAAAQQPAGQPAAATQPPAKAVAKQLDPDTLLYLGVTAGKIRGTGFVDQTGKVRGSIVGNPMKTTLGPGEGFRFNGSTDWLVLGDGSEAGRAWLPKRDFTVSSWISINKTTKYGNIIGLMEDNGNAEKGWSLGYTDDAFTFALSSTGSDDGDGKMTYLKGTTVIEADRWYHVAATYDGKAMKLYVNGQLEGQSAEQSGDILYPPKNTGAVACYLDQDEQFPMNGTLLEVKVLGRASPDAAIVEEYVPGVRLSSFQPAPEATLRFSVKPYLQFATRESMTIMAETSQPSTAIVEYGEQLPYSMRTQPSSSSKLHEIVLTGLKPQTPYFYRIRCLNEAGTELLGDDLTFQTAVNPETPFAFAIIGDTQKNKPVIEKLQQFAFTLRPNFEIHLGDVVDKGADRNEWVDELLPASWPLMSRVCMFPSIGNHEENHSNYYTYFSLPSPECWYTYTYGNAQFFVLDTNKAVDPESEQYKWLETELAKSKAVWKFAYHHHPIYSSDENDYGDTYKQPSTFSDPRHRVLAGLFEKYNLDIDFAGHIHSYDRSWPIRDGKIDMERGVRYLVMGGGGGGLESASPTRPWFTQRVYRGHHMGQIMISGKTLQLQVFDLEGRLFDTMDITKP